MEYVGNKITNNRDSMGLGMAKFTQPVLMLKLVQEYMSSDGSTSKTTAIAGQVLIMDYGDGAVAETKAK